MNLQILYTYFKDNKKRFLALLQREIVFYRETLFEALLIIQQNLITPHQIHITYIKILIIVHLLYLPQILAVLRRFKDL